MKRLFVTVAALSTSTIALALGLGPPAHGATSGPGRSTIQCTISAQPGGNTTLDCPSDYALPTREPTVAVDPNDPQHIVTAAIAGYIPDWQEVPVPESQQSIRVSTTFDGGASWTIVDIPPPARSDNWDPWITFDVMQGEEMLTFETTSRFHGLAGRCQSQMVTTSSDGGLHWGRVIVAFAGESCGERHALVLEEGKMATDNDATSPYFGRTYITGLYIFPGCETGTCTAPAAEIHSDNGGLTWTRPTVISGSNPTCTYPPNAPQCDDDPPPITPVIAPGGVVHVAFLNEQHDATWESGEVFEDQLMMVSSSDGGATWSSPIHIVDLENGVAANGSTYGDFECSPDLFFACRLSGTDLPIFPPGGYVAQTPNGSLYVVFADNRSGQHDVEHPVSNTDVFVMSSTDDGQTWTGPYVVSDAVGDQFKPSIAANPVTGQLGILFYDRSPDPNGTTMGVTLATGLPGSFKLRSVSTAPSHLSDDLWFTQTLSDCTHCVFHIGEYLGLAYGSNGTANMVWSDLRRFVTAPDSRQGYSTNVMYARGELP